MTDKLSGLKFRTSEQVPSGEVWFAERVGYDKQESVGRHGWTFSIVERYRIIGKIIGLSALSSFPDSTKEGEE